MNRFLIGLVIAWAVYELVEHIVLPVVFYVMQRRRKSECGVEALVGGIAEVQAWEKSSGVVFINGERWRAVSDNPASPGDRVVVKAVDGLTLKVAPAGGELDHRGSSP